MHYEPCLAFSERGYHILCEKPMAPTEKECIEMVEAAKNNNIILAFGHVMRYTNEYMTVKKLIDDGAIGETEVAFFRILFQRLVLNPVKHLWRSFFANIVNSF